MYKTVVTDYLPKAKDMAQVVEEKANQMEERGYELINVSMPSAKAILIFRKK